MPFPEKLTITKNDLIIIKENENLFNEIGYNFKEIKDDSIILDGIPTLIKKENLNEKIESFLEEIKNNNLNIKEKAFEKLAKSVAYTSSIRKNEKLEKMEMVELVKSLFKCESPFIGLDGPPWMITFDPKNLFDIC